MQTVNLKWQRILIATFVATVLLIPNTAIALEKTSIVLQWLPQAQFAGFFVAQDQGYYEEAGIDLTIQYGGPDVLASEYLESGKAEFATMFLSTGLTRRATLQLVNIGQFVQHSALMLIAMRDTGVLGIENLNGQKVGLWANEFQIQARALFKKKGIKVTEVPQTDSLELFMRRGVVAASGMWYNEYHKLLSYGLEENELKPFFFSEYGLDFPEDGIYALEKTTQDKPELCKAIVDATIRGWVYAFNHPEEALQSVLDRMKKAHIPANRAHQMWMLKRMEDIIVGTGEHTYGVLEEEDYNLVTESLIETGFIEEAPSFDEFYKGPRQ